jgi:hypothetical protein
VINLQILLCKEWRSPAGVKRVQEIAETLGMKPTSSGAATLSAEIDPKVFASLFGERVEQVPSRPPGKTDFGSPGGAVSGVLQVPKSLKEWVESITVAPPYTRF